MAINFPGSLDTTSSLPATAGAEVLNSAGGGKGLSSLLNDLSSAAIAIDTKVGSGSSTPVNNAVLTGNGTGTSAWVTTLAGLTLTAPIISTISNTGTLTLPTSTDTLVGKATTDTLTNKTLTAPVITNPSISIISGGASSQLINSSGVAENIEKRTKEMFPFDYVVSGGIWTGDAYGSTRNGSMTAVVAYISGIRVTSGAITAHLFTASKDTYISLKNDGTVNYTEVTNNTQSPSLPASSMWLGVVVTAAGSIVSSPAINQGDPRAQVPTYANNYLAVSDWNGNLIHNTNPNGGLIGCRFLTGTVSGYTGAANVPGLDYLAVIVPTGKTIKLTAWSPQISSTVGTDRADYRMYDSTVSPNATELATAYGVAGTSAASWGGVSLIVYVKPIAGARHYDMNLSRGSGSGSISMYGDANNGAYFTAEVV